MKTVCPCLKIGHLLLALYHARFSNGPAHQSWSPSNGQEVKGSTRCNWRVVYFSLSSGLFNRTSLPYVWQVVFANIPVWGWNIHSYEYSFFYSSSEVLCFPSQYAKIVYTSVMAFDVWMLIIWRRGFYVFFKSFSYVHADWPIYSSSHSILSHLFLCITPFFCVIVSLSWGPLRGSWWYCLLWNKLVSHVYCKCS